MSYIDRIAIGIFALIALYLWLNSPQSTSVIGSIGTNAGGLIGALQGRNVQFPGGGMVAGGPLASASMYGYGGY